MLPFSSHWNAPSTRCFAPAALDGLLSTVMDALDGKLVVSLEQAVAAPYCSRLLAEAGARVIKIERPGGDFARHYDTHVNGESAYFVWLNAGKESLMVDAKSEDEKSSSSASWTLPSFLRQRLAISLLEMLRTSDGDSSMFTSARCPAEKVTS